MYPLKAPLPPPVWSKTLEGVDKKIICPQNNLAGFILETKEIKEDCVIANVLVLETGCTELISGGARSWWSFYNGLGRTIYYKEISKQ